MREQDRLHLYRANFDKLTNEGKNNFVIFAHKASEKFVQFVGCKGDQYVVCDVPLSQLTSDQARATIFLLFSNDYERDATSYRKRVPSQDAPRLVDEIFRQVFRLPNDFDVDVELYIDAW